MTAQAGKIGQLQRVSCAWAIQQMGEIFPNVCDVIVHGNMPQVTDCGEAAWPWRIKGAANAAELGVLGDKRGIA